MARCVFTSLTPQPQRKDAMGTHDSGYKLLFSHPYLVESLIRGFVPGHWIDQLDFASLEPVSEAHPRDDIGVRYDDLIWRLRWRDAGQWVYLYLLIEFQSADEPFMAVRVLDYDAGLYRQLVRALKLKRGDKLPIVFPLVLYRGLSPWQAEEDVFDLIAPAPAEAVPYLPHLRYLLLDANAYEADRLERMRNPAACLLWLEGSRTLETRPIDQLVELLSKPEDNELRHAFTQWLTGVFLPSRLPGVTVNEVKKLEEVSSMMHENAIDWSAEWREKGWREGEAVGRREGRREGEADLLLRQLTRLYGPLSPAVEERVRNAEADQLLEWGERLVTSRSLDEVFPRG